MKSDTSSIPITTERLLIRKFTADDFSSYAAYRSRSDVYRYLYAAPPKGVELERKFLKVVEPTFEQNGDAYRLAVVRQSDKVLLGDVVLKLADKAALQAEVGYVFNPEYAGQGYASEAVEAVIDLGFRHFEFHRIFARLDTANTASVRVMERLGLRREAHLIENDRFNGVWVSEYIYAVLALEWARRIG
ncbi:GNAT family N-acetyltransferase [Neorhizobium galegae]|uniref:GNAT family N-acetyltransferase n=1 Tax=Neorhizobium galegae TaxID=399 RepID=UPI002103FC21|nr:GNAT family protein [Neorhizobium galegae]MCQ1833755.1 GNAT family N-acetyltransferase [Neorhizobium galegae]UIY30462.1 GNAT family N-acetyltransferase [Neorhizobium galegae]